MTNQDRIDQINAHIASLNAELEALKQPAVRAEEVIIDDPDQDDVDVEYRGTLILAVLVIVIVALGMLFGGKMISLVSDIKHTAAPAVVLEDITVTAPRLPEPVVVNTAAVEATTYTVQKGDTLWSIAHQHLGSGASWAVIYGQNASTIGDNPDLIFPGQTLTITKVSTGSVAVG